MFIQKSTLIVDVLRHFLGRDICPVLDVRVTTTRVKTQLMRQKHRPTDLCLLQSGIAREL